MNISILLSLVCFCSRLCTLLRAFIVCVVLRTILSSCVQIALHFCVTICYSELDLFFIMPSTANVCVLSLVCAFSLALIRLFRVPALAIMIIIVQCFWLDMLQAQMMSKALSNEPYVFCMIDNNGCFDLVTR